ncbi:MAG: bestrophin family protein, partial [Bacteroidota bacterium]|nr:bestrophin family protein [Bacteroidota bacterium]
MIIYDGNHHWFRDIRHQARSWTMIKVTRASLAVAIYSTIICLFRIELIPESEEESTLTIFTFLGVVLSILLVFRTNSAYDKWWEGRKQWGALVNNCRNLALYAHTILPPEDHFRRRFLAIRISNFCLSMVDHLRNG